MWHEARKQEKKIREAVVDFQKRAERRRQHYAKQRKDPLQLLRVYGSKCPLHLNPAASKMSSSMIPWQGDESNMISRYDVRVNLDYIPDHSKTAGRQMKSVSDGWEEQRCNYERYRFLVLNQFRRVQEHDALAAIEVNEMFLVPGRSSGSSSSSREKAKSQARAAIGYSYREEEEEEEGGSSEQARRDERLLAEYLGEDGDDDEDEEKTFSSESEYEMDIDVDCYNSAEVDRLNVLALEYGVAASSFSRNLRSEKQRMEEAKLARISDIEKSSLPGKRSRRERRQIRDRATTAGLVRLSTPPTYAQRDSPTYDPYETGQSMIESSSGSSSPAEGQVEFITEFGGVGVGGVASQPIDHAHRSSEGVGGRYGGIRSGREGGRERERRSDDGQSSRSSRYHSRSPRRRRSRSHSPRCMQSGSHSPRRRSSHHHRGSRSRSRSRSKDRSHNKRGHRSSSRERKKQRSRSRSRERGHAHPSGSNDVISATPTLSNKLPVKPKSKSVTKEKAKLTPQERLKRKMQTQLSKQFKHDKKVQKEKEHKKEAERLEREEEMRGQMKKIRGRDRSTWDPDDRLSRSPSPYGYVFSGHD